MSLPIFRVDVSLRTCIVPGEGVPEETAPKYSITSVFDAQQRFAIKERDVQLDVNAVVEEVMQSVRQSVTSDIVRYMNDVFAARDRGAT